MAVRKAKWGKSRKGGRPREEVWIVDFLFVHPDGKRARVRKKSPVNTRRGAEQHERELRVAIQNPQPTTAKEVPTLRQFSEEFQNNYVKVKNRPSEQKAKESTLRLHLLPAFGHLRLDAIGPREIDTFVARQTRDQCSAKSIRNRLAVLHRMLVVAVRWKFISLIPSFEWPKVPEPDFDFLSFEEAERLLKTAGGEWRTMVLTGLRTGMRHGELLALRWDDLDLVSGRVVVRHNIDDEGNMLPPKNGHKREVPLSTGLVAALKGHRHLRGDFVFCHPDGAPLKRSQCKWPLWTACKRAGLRRVGWHVLRHSFASQMVMRGASMKAVQELLGHRSMVMTMRYAHLSPNVKRDAVNLLEGPKATSHGSRVAAKNP